jgi:hypothetical protein
MVVRKRPPSSSGLFFAAQGDEDTDAGITVDMHNAREALVLTDGR